jgi:hypothetical protein
MIKKNGPSLHEWIRFLMVFGWQVIQAAEAIRVEKGSKKSLEEPTQHCLTASGNPMEETSPESRRCLTSVGL